MHWLVASIRAVCRARPPAEPTFRITPTLSCNYGTITRPETPPVRGCGEPGGMSNLRLQYALGYVHKTRISVGAGSISQMPNCYLMAGRSQWRHRLATTKAVLSGASWTGPLRHPPREQGSDGEASRVNLPVRSGRRRRRRRSGSVRRWRGRRRIGCGRDRRERRPASRESSAAGGNWSATGRSRGIDSRGG